MDSQEQGDTSFIELLQGDANMDNSFSDQSQQVSMSVAHSQPQVHVNNTKKSTRGSNFSIEEDKLLVSSWLNVGMDPVLGTDQKNHQFWKRVHAYYHEHKEFPSKQPTTSLTNRWSIIKKSVSKFAACLHQIEHLNQSGTTKHDKIQKAKAVFCSQNKGVGFPFEHCWNMLKGEQKWLYHGNKENQRKKSNVATSANISHDQSSKNEGEGDNVSLGTNVECERPIGRKAEKAKRKIKDGLSEDVVELMKKKTESLDDARIQGEELVRLEQERVEIERRKLYLQELDREEKLEIKKRKLQLQELDREERIMMIDTTMMSDLQKQYWNACQKEILESKL